jgi:hypothetical protein
LVIDGSGSMEEPFGTSTSRWTALRAAVLEVADRAQRTSDREIAWGLIIYDGPLPGPALPFGGVDGGVALPMPTAECPRVIKLEPKLDNWMAIAAALPATSLGGSTPSHKAFELLLSEASATGTPTTVVFATDGAPNDYCDPSSVFPTCEPTSWRPSRSSLKKA